MIYIYKFVNNHEFRINLLTTLLDCIDDKFRHFLLLPRIRMYRNKLLKVFHFILTITLIRHFHSTLQDTNVLAFSITGSVGVDLTLAKHTRNTGNQQVAGMELGRQ